MNKELKDFKEIEFKTTPPPVDLETDDILEEERTKKPEMTEKEKECQEYVETNKKTVSETLSNLIKDKQFILIGEHHLDSECEPIRREITMTLVKLQQEGLTHIALEANSKFQTIIDNLDFADPKIEQILKEKKIGGGGWGKGNFDILIMAKRLDIKVILIDHNDGREDSQRNNAQWQNERDINMMKTIKLQINKKSKVLILIGSAHVHKKSVEKYQDGRVTRLGAHLVQQFGNEAVSSIRHINQGENFDGLLSFMSKTTSPEKISVGKKEVVVIPDQGAVKGDERVTASDYIITLV